MVRLAAPLTMVALLASASTEAQTLVISRGGSRAVRPDLRRISLVGSVSRCCSRPSPPPTPAAGLSRSSLAPDGVARASSRPDPDRHCRHRPRPDMGRPHREIRAGDVVRIPAGQKHWHGASPQASMTHIAITEHRDGTVVEWMEKVSDDRTTRQRVRSKAPPDLRDHVSKHAPGMAALTDEVLYGDVWRRPELSPATGAW